jgi:transcriptional regulator with XRE-family HTH domain
LARVEPLSRPDGSLYRASFRDQLIAGFENPHPAAARAFAEAELDQNSIIVDILSTMKESKSDLNHRIAERVRGLRTAQGLSLDALAGKCGVSRSMISLVERGESSPTAVVLEKLAAGLGATLASLFDPPTGIAPMRNGPVARRTDQAEWQDPASGYRRRNVSPSGGSQPMRIVDVHFPAGARVAFESGERNTRVLQQVWLLEGTMDITVGAERHRLHEGDCLAMQLDRPTMFHNPTRKPARYAVVLATEIPAKR